MEAVAVRLQAVLHTRTRCHLSAVSRSAMFESSFRSLLIFHYNSVSSRRRAFLLMLVACSIILVFPFRTSHGQNRPDINSSDPYIPVRPFLAASGQRRPEPLHWLQENSNNKYAVSRSILPHLPAFGSSRRPRAALISLVRNSELAGMMQSMRQLEFRWNKKYEVGVFGEVQVYLLTLCSTHGYFSMTNLLLRNSKLGLRTQHQRDAITKLFRKSIGPCRPGLTRADS
jgi:hypothetical protein